jgi:methionyl-tRNA formyltransferase
VIDNPHLVFMGSPQFAVPVLEAIAGRYNLVGVVTQPDRPVGRGRSLTPPAVKISALQLQIPVIQPEKIRHPDAFSCLQAWSPDLIVVAAFGQILRQPVLDLPCLGCLNVHASLLPRWRGAAPIQAAILAGDSETGITIMKMDAGIDSGAILSQRNLKINEGEDSSSLSHRLAALGASLLLETLPGYVEGSIVPHPQPETGSTYAPLIKKEDGFLDFTQPATDLERRVRAMHPWPGASMEWQEGRLKIIRSRAGNHSSATSIAPGTRLVMSGEPVVVASERTVLVLEEVQPAGKKAMPGRAFIAGARDWQS